MRETLERPAHIIATDLLRLRAFAIAAFCGLQHGVREVDGIPTSSWDFFLRLERCAAALLDKTTATRLLDRLSPAVQDVLRTVAAHETQSVLRARVQGREIAEVVRAIGCRALVLKGGVPAISGENPPLPIADIDLLVERRHIEPLVSALATAGFGVPSRALPHHQAIAPSTDKLAVEVHWTTHDDGAPVSRAIWDNAGPLATAPPLERPGNVEYVAHLLEHAMVTHTERSPSLRDTILIGRSAKRCTPTQMTCIRKQIARGSDELTRLLDFAIAIESGSSAPDSFQHRSATFYASAALQLHFPRALSTPGALAFVTGVAQETNARTFRRLFQWRGTGVESISRVAERAPHFAPLVLIPLRIAFYGVVSAAALPMIAGIRRKALRNLPRQIS